ncbi:MAG: hypothetical protein ACYTG6_06620 [Planctomycetota bacterium]
MQKLTLIVAAGALGLAAWQVMEADGLRSDVTRQQQEITTLTTDLSRLRSEVRPQDALPDLLTEAPTPAGGEDADPVLDARAADPRVLAQAVRDMRERMAEQERTIASLQEQVASPSQGQQQTRWRRPRFINDVDSAVSELDLDGGQQAELERIIEDTKRRIEDLRMIPNAEGKTWADVNKTRTRVASGDDGDLTVLLPNFRERTAFLNSHVPGTDETYSEAERRIRNEGKSDVRRMLTPEQEEKWDDAHTDGLFGQQGDHFVVSSIVTDVLVEEDD